MKRLTKASWLTHLFLIALGVVMIYPLIWLVASSFKPNDEIFTTLTLWPAHFQWSNYAKGWNAMRTLPFSVFLRNSLFVSGMNVIGQVLSSTLVAYGFTRINFRFKGPLFALLLATLMLPAQAQLVPQYIVYKNLGWVNTYLPLIVPAFCGGAFFIFLMVQFMRGIPKELDEAAEIDGCNRFMIYARIILPLCKPAIATVSIFAFLWSWDDFLNPAIYISDPTKFTIPLGLRLFLDNTLAVSWGGLFAMSVVSILPNLILFLAAQKHFVEGISTSGLKG
ncbi:MAG: carbohydrate ABC transporter permease [Mycobacterium leprae]